MSLSCCDILSAMSRPPEFPPMTGETHTYTLLDPAELVASMYQSGTDGVIFGRQHGVHIIHDYTAQTVIPLAAALGVTDLYVEESVSWQNDWEEFVRTGIYTPEWNTALESVSLSWGGNEDPRPVYEALRGYPHIRVTFFDVPEDRWGRRIPVSNIHDPAYDRDEFMKYMFLKQPPKGRYIVLGGSAHGVQKKSKDAYGHVTDTFATLIRGEGYKTQTISAVGDPTHEWYTFYKFFNGILPMGHGPIALDLKAEAQNHSSIAAGHRYYGTPSSELFDGLVFFPHVPQPYESIP